MRVVLASASPRRKALLAALGIPVEVHVSHAPEVDHGQDPESIVTANARAKRDAVLPGVEGGAVVVAADTLVFLDGEVLSKPADHAEARDMLRRLSGRTHEVVTGLAVANTAADRAAEGSETTHVTFRDLSDDEIARFVEVVNPVDRAGAYTVDGPGSLLVARYGGCFQNVLGLPIVRLDLLLRETGVRLFDLIRPELARFL